MAKQNVKPVGYKPNGWWIREMFVDDEGNVFQKGKLIPELKDQHEKSRDVDARKLRSGETKEDREASEKKSEKVSDDKKASEQSLEQSKSGLSEEISANVLKALENKFDEEWRKRESRLRAEFESSLQKSGTAGITYHELARAFATAESYRRGEKVYSDLKDLDPKDYDPKGATFTSYGNGYLIVDDVRQGQAVRTPYNRNFKFKFQGSRVTLIGRTESYSSFCSFITNSKKEIEWMRNHTLYNIVFFEDTKRAISADAKKAEITAAIVRTITALDQPEILKRAQSVGITLGGDIRVIISELAYKLAEQRIEQELKAAEEKNISSFETKTFVE